MTRQEIVKILDEAAARSESTDGASRAQCYKLACMMEESGLTPDDPNLDDPRSELSWIAANQHIEDLK